MIELDTIKTRLTEALRITEKAREEAETYEKEHKGEFGTYATVCGIYSSYNRIVADMLKNTVKNL